MAPRKLRVLVIDDSAFNRQAIASMLESRRSGLEVIGTAADGEEGLKLALRSSPTW